MARATRASMHTKPLRTEYEALYAVVLQQLTTADLVGLTAAGAPANEYEPEVGTILPRLRTAGSPADVSRIVHEEFVRWFSADLAGPLTRYTAIGIEIWQVYQTHLGRSSTSSSQS